MNASQHITLTDTLVYTSMLVNLVWPLSLLYMIDFTTNRLWCSALGGGTFPLMTNTHWKRVVDSLLGTHSGIAPTRYCHLCRQCPPL